MITKDSFVKLIDLHKTFSQYIDKFEDVSKISIVDSPLFDNFYKLFDITLNISFNNVAVEDISWWIYEKEYGTREDMKMWDKDHNEIPSSTIDDLWNMIKDNCI